ncbi:hypothetical protein MycrhDRAFT_0709 [Mycolicibacterium rhodesiae JS60]|nr:hypothetical protein MycrhDRAFT_0709 [Mycolicibacterium rhodesiae JS60]
MSTSRVWGSFAAYPARYGVARYRLVVFPPGMTVGERRILRLWRGWPLWGAALWLGLQIGGELSGMPETALIAGSMIYIAVGALTFALAGETRMRVRTLCAVSASQHEARWWQVYDALDAMPSTAPSPRASHTPSAISAATSKPAIPRSTKPSGINIHHR